MATKKGYIISIGLNAFLFGLLVVRSRPLYLPARGENRDEAAVPSASTAARTETPARAVEIGSDWRNWIESLRVARVPSDVLAGLVQADFDRRWQSRQAALQKKYMRGEIDADGLAVAEIEREAEADRELQAALGPEEYRAWDMRRLLGELNVDQTQISERERDALYELKSRVREELRQAQSDKLKGVIDQATLNSRQENAQKAIDEALRGMLGEKAASELREPDSALGTLKRALKEMPLSETQIETLAEAQRQWDRVRAEIISRQVSTEDATLNEALRANDEAWREKFDRVAGTQAFDRFTSAQDSRYLELQRHATQWGLSPGEVEHVFAELKDFEDIALGYRREAAVQNIDSTEVDATLRAFAEKTENTMKAQLGDRTYSRLVANGIKPVQTP